MARHPQEHAMAATFRHFAINADDVARARAFYEKVFGWQFQPWGPPNFYQIRNAGPGHMGALQERRELGPGRRAVTFECSMGVENLAETMAAVEANGGRVLFPPYTIEGVGDITYLEDPEGNFCGIAQYVEGLWK
jgi:predicted enzyme related to lactoylglutathione lyase